MGDFLSGTPTMKTTSFYDRPTRVGANLVAAVLVTGLQLEWSYCVRRMKGRHNDTRTI
jgi:hypothetical protein